MRYEKEDMFTVIHTFFPKLDVSVYNYPMWQPIHTAVQDTYLHKKDDLDPYLVKTINTQQVIRYQTMRQLCSGRDPLKGDITYQLSAQTCNRQTLLSHLVYVQ